MDLAAFEGLLWVLPTQEHPAQDHGFAAGPSSWQGGAHLLSVQVFDTGLAARRLQHFNFRVFDDGLLQMFREQQIGCGMAELLMTGRGGT